ncbi:MAG: metal ABC transporter substrate-binding protein [Prevotellaceae bacterium]|nr:metal ABC transporter substrate-binding protein [Prevotellaceae bacterium]
MKKIISIMIAMLMVLGLVSTQSFAEETKKINVVTTTFPIYDWTRNILGDNIDHYNLEMLLDNGVDLHSYQPSVDDIVKIGNADLFIYTGGVSDTWAKDAINNATNKNIKVINLVETLGDKAKAEELVEGMEDHDDDHDHDDHDHDDEDHDDHDHDDEDHDDHDHEDEDHDEHEHHHEHIDEHVWLSLKNADKLCKAIAEQLCAIDQQNADSIMKNYEEYSKQLEDLDDEYEDAVEKSTNKTILVADRLPLRYLVDDYDLKYYAAFSGCSAESEASFETVAFLAKKLNELKLKNVLTIDGRTNKIAETVIQTSENKDQNILVLDSMQSVSAEAVKNGASYLTIMKDNLEVLKQALQ